MTSGRMTIVGNAPPQFDLDDFIDGSDLVVRFNSTGNLDMPGAGSRTDVLCVRAIGSIGDRFVRGESPLDPRALASAREFWFLVDGGEQASEIIARYRLGDRKHRYLRAGHMREADGLLAGFGGAGEGASLGSIAVVFALRAPEFAGFRKAFCCFGFEGWHGHPWREERRMFESLCASGAIETPEARPYFHGVPRFLPVINVENRLATAARGPLHEDDVLIAGMIDGRRSIAAICEEYQAIVNASPRACQAAVLRLIWRLESGGAVSVAAEPISGAGS